MRSTNRLWALDTSVLVAYLRFGRHREFLKTNLEMGTVILPGVVLCELYAGAASPLDAKDLQQIRAAFGPRILRTEIRDWTLAGQCISAYSRLWGKISPGNHIPDILVAISAIRASAVLGTHNAKDMLRWGRILEQFGKKLKIEKIPD